MNSTIVIFLLLYFVAFFGIAVIWRSYAVTKETGLHVFKLHQKEGSESVINMYFKFLPLVSILVFLIAALFPEFYLLIGLIELLNHSFIQWVGMGIMVVALFWVILAQSHMGASWRIGIDYETKTAFVQKGLFKYSRNPIFVGVIFISLGYFLVLPNPITFTILALDIALIQIQVALEEEYLKKQHGQDYVNYCHQVRRWL